MSTSTHEPQILIVKSRTQWNYSNLQEREKRGILPHNTIRWAEEEEIVLWPRNPIFLYQTLFFTLFGSKPSLTQGETHIQNLEHNS